MTRSSRHNSSKHRSDFSDSDKDLSSSKDRKDARVSKEASEKRKLDSKESDYVEELVPSKKRKERAAADGGSDRWNGGEYDQREKKMTVKASGQSKSRKRDGSVVMYAEEAKKSGGGLKSREKDRKEAREGGGVEREKEKRSKEGRGGEEDHHHRVVVKKGNDNSDLNGRVELESPPEQESQIDRQMRKKRGESGDNDKHLEFEEDMNGGRLLSKDDVGREGRQKDEKRRDDRYREKFREDVDRENKPRDEKQRDEKERDERSSKDHLSSKSEDKHLKDEKDTSDMQQKRSKLQDGERKGEHDRDRNRDRDSYHVRERYHDREHWWDHGRDREHWWDHGRDRDREYDRDWDWDRERVGDRDREKHHDRERARDRDRDGERDCDRYYDRDYDGSRLDNRSARYKDSSRGKGRSPDDRDDSSDAKPRGLKPRYSDFEKKSSSGDRVEPDVNKRIPQSREAYADTTLNSTKRKTSPNSNVGIDEYRDSVAEQRSKALPPRDVSGVSERGYKYRSMEKSNKMDDSHFGELLNEKPSGSKASPKALMERSPSLSSIDRRSRNKTAARRSIDIEETGRRGSASDNRGFSVTEDRLSRELQSEKPFMDDSSTLDSSTHNRSSQSNFSSFAPHPNFRAGSVEDDGRGNSNARYRRSTDPNMVRGPWRGVPNWPSQVPNGFMPFPHGGPHGGFQGMLPQFSAPPIFGVRPSMEMNPYGIPFQMADDRFPGHMRPLGSQNIMEGLGPPHMHPWDGSTGAFRDDSNSYGAEWDQSRHPMSARGWDPNAESWKAQNSEGKRDMTSPSPRNDHPSQALVDNVVAGQLGQTSHDEDNQDFGLNTERHDTGSPMKDSLVSHDKPRDDSKSAIDKVPSFSHNYLSKLDISTELADTELYTQCMSLLGTEGSVTVNEDTTVHTILKAAKTGLRSAKSLLSSSLFPPLNNSVFQKALDLYKKERVKAKVVPYVAGGRLDIILAANQKTMEANVSEVNKVNQPAMKCDAEMEKLEEPVPTPGQELQNHFSFGSSELEIAVEDSSRVEQVVPQPIPIREDMDSISSEQLKVLEVGEADGVSLLISEASLPTTTTLPAVGDNLSQFEEDKYAEEGLSVDAIRGPSVMPDGSPEACDALISGSNESDLVILSRIHHSPESTH